MNTFNTLANTVNDYEEFTGADLIKIADIYRDAKIQLARFFDYLSQEDRDRFYGYAKIVREYEEKVSKEDGIERMNLN